MILFRATKLFLQIEPFEFVTVTDLHAISRDGMRHRLSTSAFTFHKTLAEAVQWKREQMQAEVDQARNELSYAEEKLREWMAEESKYAAAPVEAAQ